MATSTAWDRLTAPFVSAKPARPVEEDTPVNADDYTSEFNRLMADADVRHVIYSVFDAELDDLTQQMVDGSFDPFTGPINDQDGNEVIADGVVPGDGDLLGMSYFVAGVIGSASG